MTDVTDKMVEAEAMREAGALAEKPDDHVWVKCPAGHGGITHQHFDMWCGLCPTCGAVMMECDAPANRAAPTPSDLKIATPTGWKSWAGGSCPVEAEEKVDIILDDASVFFFQTASDKYWEAGKPHGQQIVAFRNSPTPSDRLPPAYGGCTCGCHRIPGMMHMVACCAPETPTPFDHVELLKACERIIPYLNFTIGDESPGYPPTMPSAVGAFKHAVKTARALPPATGLAMPIASWREQAAFEAWAKESRYEMHQHPLHYLFMDKQTNAARQGWKAALAFVRELQAAAASEGSTDA